MKPPHGTDRFNGLSGSWREFIGRNPEACMMFSFVFIIVLSATRLASPGNMAGVEQWINLSNAMFHDQQDMLFSYGPLYWLTGQIIPPHNIYSYWIAIIGVSLFTALFWSLLFVLSYKARAVIFFGLTYFLFFDVPTSGLAAVFLSFALIMFLEYSKPGSITLDYRAWFATGLFVALCFYIRFFYGLFGSVAIVLYLAPQVFKSKETANILGFCSGVLIGYLLFGLLIFHDLSSLIDYVVINSQLSFGNSVDMTYDVPNTARSFAAVGVLWLAFNVYLILKRRALILPVNFMILVFFKLGFSRTDHYLGYFVTPIALLSLMLLFDASRTGRAMFLVVTAMLFYLASVPNFPGAVTRNRLLPTADFDRTYAEKMQSAYSSFTLEPDLLAKVGQSTIDVYPYNNEYLFANRLNYRHRPVFQNYMTLTPRLDAMNQRFLSSSARPEFILWTAGVSCASAPCNVFNGFDEKFLLNEDPLTSSAILLNYRLIQTSHGRNGIPVALFEARHPMVEASLPASPLVDMRFGTWYPVPAHPQGVIKLMPRFEFTILGRIKNLLFRGSIVTMSYRLASGDVRQYRLNILNAGSGLWVSPLVDNFNFQGDLVESIKFDSKLPGYLQPVFKASWATLPLDFISTRQTDFNGLAIPNTELGETMKSTCPASIDTADGYSPLPARIDASRSLNVHGWLARSTDQGQLFDQTLLTLTNAEGQRVYLSTNPELRTDVATAFNNAGLAQAGFKSRVDLTALGKGSYALGLAGVSEAGVHICSQFAIPLFTP
jgi:hypothetical protein